jgi:hypothetical protein
MPLSDDILISAAVYGLAIVISLLVAVLIAAIVRLLAVFDGKTRRESAPPAPAAAAALPTGVPRAHVAAIAAAVSQTIRGARVVHIEDRAGHQEWAFEGRMMHQTSHDVPTGRR